MLIQKNFFHTRRWVFYSFILLIFAGYCRTAKSVSYSREVTNTFKISIQVLEQTYETHKQPDDVPEIIINNINSVATAPFNLGNTNLLSMPISKISPTTVGAQLNTYVRDNGTGEGDLVDKNDAINFPVLSEINMERLTVRQSKDSSRIELGKYLQEPTVNVQLLNYSITILGDWLRRGLTGDLPIYLWHRKNVLLMVAKTGNVGLYV